MTLTKDVLFYSNYCLFSKDVLSRIMKLNVKQHVVLICVDVYKRQLPPTLTVVPTLMTPDGDMITEDEIFDRLSMLTSQHVPRDMYTHSGAAFSFVDDADGDGSGGGGSGGGYGGEDHYGIFGEEQSIYTPDEDSIDPGNNGLNSGGAGHLTFEQLQAQREQEMQVFFKNNPRT
jgi:hypothetical protein